MSRPVSGIRTATVVACALALSLPALSASGRVLAPDGKPVQGARACYVTGGDQPVCAETDSEGFYSLPDLAVRQVRISYPGYLIERVDAGPLEQPVRLRPAASLEVSFVDDADELPVEGAFFFVVRPDGLRQGPMGPTNRSGTVIVQTLAPGGVTVQVYAPGFVPPRQQNVRLEGGKRSTLSFRLQRLDDAPGS